MVQMVVSLDEWYSAPSIGVANPIQFQPAEIRRNSSLTTVCCTDVMSVSTGSSYGGSAKLEAEIPTVTTNAVAQALPNILRVTLPVDIIPGSKCLHLMSDWFT